MSFIYDDKNLINQLLNAGSDFENKYLKTAQVAPSTDKSLLTTLVSAIEKELPNIIDIPPSTVLDSVARVFPEGSVVGSGDAKITSLELGSIETFNRWMKTNDIQVTKGGATHKFDDPEFDPTVVIKGLNARAQLLQSKATGDVEKNKANAYAKQTSTLASSVTFKGQAADGGPTGTSGESTEMDVNKLEQVLPFQSYNIDFDRITQFINLYVSMMRNSKSQAAATRLAAIMTSAKEALSDIETVTSICGNRRVYDMNSSTDPGTVVTWCKTPQQYKNVLNGLSNIMTQTNNIIATLVSAQGEHISEQKVAEQRSIFERQSSFISNLLNRSPR